MRRHRFGLERGSLHALSGGNGAGKSTFLEIVMGIGRRDGGTVIHLGREPLRRSGGSTSAA